TALDESPHLPMRADARRKGVGTDADRNPGVKHRRIFPYMVHRGSLDARLAVAATRKWHATSVDLLPPATLIRSVYQASEPLVPRQPLPHEGTQLVGMYVGNGWCQCDTTSFQILDDICIERRGSQQQGVFDRRIAILDLAELGMDDVVLVRRH